MSNDDLTPEERARETVFKARNRVNDAFRERLRAEDELRASQRRVFEQNVAFEKALDELTDLATQRHSEEQGK